MNKINWAQANWHVWSNSILGYPPPNGCEYYPHEGFSYQCNLRNHDRFSMLKDDEVSQLVKSVRTGEKLMRWRLQHFTDRHVNELLKLLRLGALTEPDPSSIGLMMIAYRHWQQFDNLKIAQVLVLHLLRAGYTHADVLDELYSEQILRGEKRDKGFIRFVDNCGIVMQHERLLEQLKPKLVADTKKVKL